MLVTETLSEGLKRGFTVKVPAASIESKHSAKLAELGKTLRLPGFRPGKVPATLVKQRYGQSVLGEVLEAAVNEATDALIAERNLRSVTKPRLELVSAFGAGDLEFKVEVELFPEFSLPELGGLSLTRQVAEVPGEKVDTALSEIASRQKKLVDVEDDRGAEMGDTLVVDFKGTVDGVAFEGGTGTGMPVELGGQGFIPGFAEGMIGMKAGESRDVPVTFPENYHATDLAGKPAVFAITATKLQKGEVPAIDDEFASTLGFESLEKVRELITSQIKREYDQLSRLRLKRDLLDALAGLVDFPVPVSMVDAEFAQIWARLEADRKAGQLDPEDAGKDEETLKADYRAIAERRVRLGLLLAEIGRVNKVQVAPEELNRAIQAEAMRYRGQEAQVFDFFRKNPQAIESLRGPIFEDKVVDFIVEMAKVPERRVSPQELLALPEPDGENAAGAAASGETSA
jgi:trigger factor